MPKFPTFDLEARLGETSSHGVAQPICDELASKLFPLTFQTSCESSSNSHQLSSSFDEDFINQTASKGFPPCNISLPNEIKKEYDTAISTPFGTVVIEIEKSNWEKFLYDLLKAHIYLSHGADFCCIILPQHWAHKHGEKEVYKGSKERLDLARKYQCGNPEIFNRIFLIGYEQYWNNKLFDKAAREKMRIECKSYFNGA